MSRIVTVTAGGLCLLLMSGRGPVVAQGAKMAVLSGDPGQVNPADDPSKSGAK
jgi:hypothetical protein